MKRSVGYGVAVGDFFAMQKLSYPLQKGQIRLPGSHAGLSKMWGYNGYDCYEIIRSTSNISTLCERERKLFLLYKYYVFLQLYCIAKQTYTTGWKRETTLTLPPRQHRFVLA